MASVSLQALEDAHIGHCSVHHAACFPARLFDSPGSDAALDASLTAEVAREEAA